MINNKKRFLNVSLAIVVILLIIGGVSVYYFKQSKPSRNIFTTDDNNKFINPANFNCSENKKIQALFFKDRVELSLSDGRNMLISQAVSASGVRYANTDESFVFWNKGDTAFVNEGNKTTFKDCLISTEESSTTPEKNNLVSDIYPLYSNLLWNNEIATTTNMFGLQFSGFGIDTRYITDDKYNKLDPSFREYYDTKLTAKGWVQNKDYDADGAGSSVWGYTKGKDVIILSYHSTAINQKPNEPLSCPCNMTFYIFSGEKI